MRDAQHPSTTRRTVLRTAAWTAPAVAVVAAAPAHAASTAGSLLASFGTTNVTTDGSTHVVNASGMSVVSSTALAAGELSLVVTFPLDSGESTTMYGNGSPAGWTYLTRFQGTPIVYQYAGPVAAGAAVPFPDDLVAVSLSQLVGTFQLVFTAGSVSSQVLSLRAGQPI